jgi:4'-phosphopantetheinyl transferase EntD
MGAAAGEIGEIERRLRDWFPPPAFVRAARITERPMLPEERALVANAVSRRQNEFATGRWLARQGLRSFGLPDRPVGMGRLRDPLWPAPVRGTLSHDGELCAVVMEPKQEHGGTGIGIDLIALPQRAGRLDDLLPMFMAHPDELAAMAAFDVAVEAPLLLFSLKESLIKALSFRLDDFVDMRAIEMRLAERPRITLAGSAIDAELHASVAREYLVTAAKVH